MFDINNYKILENRAIQLTQSNILYYYDFARVFFQNINGEYFLFCFESEAHKDYDRFIVSRITQEKIDGIVNNENALNEPYDIEYAFVHIDLDGNIIEVIQPSETDIIPVGDKKLRPL